MSSSQVEKRHKKRKSAPAVTQDEDVNMEGGGIRIMVEDPSSSAGPVWANFPSVKPSKSTPFTLYSRTPGSTADLSKQRTILAGETEDVEFCSNNRDDNATEENENCSYLPGIYDPQTNTLHLAPAPIYHINLRAKRLRPTAPPAGAALTVEYRARRNALGETFGTRKAKNQIKADERNRVDVAAMEGVKDHLMLSIGEKEEVMEDSLVPYEMIPAPDLLTLDVTAVYPIDSIISDSDLSAITVTEIMKAKDDKSRMQLLPHRHSRWIEAKMRNILHGPQAQRKQQLKLIFYLSLLLQLLDSSPTLTKTPTTELPKKFPNTAPQLIHSTLLKFTEPSGKRFTLTEKCKTKLLMWICCLFLCLDGWSIEVGKVARELRMEETKVANMFKSLGCSIDLPTATEREKNQMTLSEAQKHRRATLKAPVKFPKIKSRGPVKR